MLLDRNATVHDLESLVHDVKRMLADPNVVIVIPGRGTTNTLTPIGQGSQMVEEGHRSFLKGLISLLGGGAGEVLGTGWGNILRVDYGGVQRGLVSSGTPEMPLTSRMRRGSSFALRLDGLIGFGPHAVGISEDTWAVSQAAHNAVALGRRPKFLLSTALWHKIRETWSHSEWLSSFPRWSGGYLQMMQDPIMQKINDFGPFSVFAKEVRANSGRFYLTALFTLLNILLMPLAIVLDVTPFVQILIVLWNFGFIMNQVLALHGLQTCIESAGFARLPALAGAIGAGCLGLASEGARPFAPALAVLGALGGGFIAGIGRWFGTRLQDVILFGPQLVLHALGQFVRQSLEFIVSGASPEDAKGVNVAFRAWAGPREDRPLDRYPNLLNLRTVVWVVGFFSLLLNLTALSKLDLLNVLMLLPSLLFSVSALLGPFLMAPKPGPSLGARAFWPKALAWGTGVAFYFVVSWLVAAGGFLAVAGAGLATLVFGAVIARGGRYLFYRTRLNRAIRQLAQLLPQNSGNLLGEILGEASAGGTVALEKAALDPASFEKARALVRERLGPLLRQPMEDRTAGRFAGSRFYSEFSRSFVLSLFVLLWFAAVPVPGLFVFTAGDRQFALELARITEIVLGGVALALLACGVGRLLQAVQFRQLKQRILDLLGRTEALRRSGGWTPLELASTSALFTDVRTYIDQRAHAHTRASIDKIERSIAQATSRQTRQTGPTHPEPPADPGKN